MSQLVSLSKYISRNFFREKSVIILLIGLPLILLNSAKRSALVQQIAVKLDGILLMTNASDLLVISYAMTAIVFTAATTSYFIVFNNKKIIPRLIVSGYTRSKILLGMFIIIVGVNFLISIIVWLYVINTINIKVSLGFYTGLFMGSLIFSTIGLILADSVENKTLGLYTLLTLGMLDTAFLENPVLSRRYNENWIFLMPARGSVEMLFRSYMNTGVFWMTSMGSIFLYEIILLFGYFGIKHQLNRS